jgi:hypothetical protein
VGPLALGSGACDTTPGALCALPNADVNVRLGERTFTTRADRNGTWALSVPLPVGWSELTFSQVVDSFAGGAWSESCRSNGTGVGVQTPGGPLISTPGDMTVPATSVAGAPVSYTATAVSASDGVTPVPVTCVPPSGSTFPLGLTAVLCTAIDTANGAVGLAHFLITVVDAPPVINVPPGITVEATSALGAMVSYDVTATDVEDGTDPVDCTPASPAQFPLDTPTTVSCTATDSAGATSTASFVVQVVDTTPPVLCPLQNLVVGTNSGAGAVVTYTTCANDIVDGSDPVNCDHQSGSFFPVGTTVVSCSSTDKHGNKSPVSTFTVCVGDTTPPVLSLPAPITVHATSRLGAKVSYVATATDNVDPHPTVTCTPPSGAQFPLGTTTVNCTAKDASGNKSTGSFTVSVIVSWTGFLFPIQIDGTLRWEQKVPLPVVFALLDGSAGIHDLPAKLFVAPLDATGHPGAERPAPKIPPIGANGFDFIPLLNDYLFVLDTRPLALGPWQLRADLGDGQLHTVKVTLVQ